MTLFFGAYTQFFDANGDPMSGAKLYFYEAGTTTPKDTYTDYTLGTPNSNPVEADADGRMGGIWLGSGAYKAILKTAGDATIWSVDYVTGNQLDILTTRGDLLTRNASAYARLALGSAGQGLVSDGSDAVWSTIPALSAANVWTATQTISSTDASASGGPVLKLYRDSASPATSDFIGEVKFAGENSAAAEKTYVQYVNQILDATSGSEDAQTIIQAMVAGSLTSQILAGNGVILGAATGGYLGTGTINATNYYKNGVAFAIQSEYDSGELSITAAGTHNLNHLLAVKPKVVTLSLICKSAEGGYSVNDEVLIPPSNGWDDKGVGMRLTTSQCQIKFGSNANSIGITNFSTGGSFQITDASWRLRVRAYA